MPVRSYKRKRPSTSSYGIKRRRTARSIRRPWRLGRNRRIRRRRTGGGRGFIYNFNRNATADVETSNVIDLVSTSKNIFKQFRYRIDQVQALTDFSALFKYYRVNLVVHTLRWSPSSDVFSNVTTQLMGPDLVSPTVFWQPNYDNTTTANTVEEFKESQRARRFRIRPGREYKIMVKPSIRNVIEGNVAFNAAVPKWKQWLPFSQLSPLYGIDLMVEKNDLFLGQVSVKTRYYFSCKYVQ